MDHREEERIPEPDVRREQEGRVSGPPVQLFRCLKRTAIVLMLLFRLDKPVGESEIAEILDLHPETTRIYLRSLAGLGLVTRTHRYRGWTLTAGGRQMILGEADNGWNALEAGKIKTNAEKPRSITESPTASAEVSTGKVKVKRSLVSRGFQLAKRRERMARGRPGCDAVVRANLEAFGSIGVMRNEFVLKICKMGHVSSDYILGQKKRLEAERRYSHGLLLTVVRSNDYLPEKYLASEDSDSQPQLFKIELGSEDEGEHIQEISTSSIQRISTGSIQRIEPHPSIYEPISGRGMSAAKAWSGVLGQLKVDMPKAEFKVKRAQLDALWAYVRNKGEKKLSRDG